MQFLAVALRQLISIIIQETYSSRIILDIVNAFSKKDSITSVLQRFCCITKAKISLKGLYTN